MYALHDTVFSCKFLVINLPCRVGSVNNNNNNKDTYKQRSLKKTQDALQAFVIQCCGTGVSSGVVQNLPSTVTKRRRSVGGLFQMSGPETAKFLRPMVVAVRCTLSLPEAVDLRCRRPASSTTGGASARRHLLTKHRDLVFYPQVNRKPVQIPQDWCDVVKLACSGDQPCCGILNSLQLSNDAVSSSNQ